MFLKLLLKTFLKILHLCVKLKVKDESPNFQF